MAGGDNQCAQTRLHASEVASARSRLACGLQCPKQKLCSQCVYSFSSALRLPRFSNGEYDPWAAGSVFTAQVGDAALVAAPLIAAALPCTAALLHASAAGAFRFSSGSPGSGCMRCCRIKRLQGSS